MIYSTVFVALDFYYRSVVFAYMTPVTNVAIFRFLSNSVFPFKKSFLPNRSGKPLAAWRFKITLLGESLYRWDVFLLYRAWWSDPEIENTFIFFKSHFPIRVVSDGLLPFGEDFPHLKSCTFLRFTITHGLPFQQILKKALS